jgi:hypothetical protein
MKPLIMKLTAPLCKTMAHLRIDSKPGMNLCALSVGLGMTAAFAALAVLPTRAEDTASSVNTPLAGMAATLAPTTNVSPVASLTGVETDATVLPSGAVRRTVRRVRTVTTEQQPLGDQMALADNMLKMPLQPNLFAMRQAAVGGHPLSVDLRLGVSVSPRVKFVGGIDARIPGLSLGRGFTTRADFDAVVAANFGGVSTLFPLTIDELYHADIPGVHGLYGGLGVGPMFGEVTRFGGKIIIGGTITPRLRLEGNVLFAGYGDPLLNLQLRIPIL